MINIILLIVCALIGLIIGYAMISLKLKKSERKC